MQPAFLDKVRELSRDRNGYVLATVIAVRGSSSAKPGSKAVISHDGRNIMGWIGGGCAESFLLDQALEALAVAEPRVVTVDLDDELLGVGMPCGGYMDVYLEPVLPAKPFLIVGSGPVSRPLCVLAGLTGFDVSVQSAHADSRDYPLAQTVGASVSGLKSEDGAVVFTSPADWSSRAATSPTDGQGYVGLAPGSGMDNNALKEVAGGGSVFCPAGFLPGGAPAVNALGIVAQVLAVERGADGAPLSLFTPDRTDIEVERPELAIIGRGRIAEALARIGSLLSWPVTVNDTGLCTDDYPGTVRLVDDDLDMALAHLNTRSFVVIASQHKGDHRAALTALQKKVPYIALIASKKRSGLVFDFLREKGCDTAMLASIRAPAGLAIGSRTPFEIALSIFCEMLRLFPENRGVGEDHGS